MAEFDRVPVVEVNKDTIKEFWPALVLSVQTATYIAIDTELSGLGNRKLLNARDLDDRYHHMCEVARTRSIVSLGLSCFKLLPNTDPPPGEENGTKAEKPARSSTKLRFQVQTYNIIMLCSDQYVVEPMSLRFLVEHGFDFNKQYSCGLPYHRGNDKEEDKPEPSVRQLFTEVVLSRAPVVFHNGVVDLVFLYHSLFATLPTTQQGFLANINEIFPAGVFDTKYITDFKARMGASYLEFVFRKCQRDNILSERQGWSHVNATFLDYASAPDTVIHQPCGLPDMMALEDLSIDALCMQYANHGWCPNGNDCSKSHDIDVILETQDRATPSKKHKASHTDKKESLLKMSEDVSASSEDDSKDKSSDKNISNAGSHRAGFDAFMTGFIFGFYSARYGKVTDDVDSEVKGSELGMEEHKNKAYLVGKDIPLQIMKSSFVKFSKEHKAKVKKIGLT